MRYALLTVAVLCAGCAANRVSFSEKHWYPNGLQKSEVNLNQMQVATWKSGVEDGDNSFVRLDDQSIESGNKSSATTSSVDPNLLIAALEPFLVPELAGPVAAAPAVGGTTMRLLNLLKVLSGNK